MKKSYIKPIVGHNTGTVYGLPTVLAIGAASAVVGAAAAAVGKAVGNVVQCKVLASKEIGGTLS